MPVTMYSVTEASTKSGIHPRVIRKRCAEERIGCQHASSQEWFLTAEEIERLTHVKRPRGRPVTTKWDLIDKLILAKEPAPAIASAFGISISSVHNRSVKLRKQAATPPEHEHGT